MKRPGFFPGQYIFYSAVAAMCILSTAPVSAQVQSGQRSYTPGRFALEIDGAFAGWLQSVEGGHAVSDAMQAASADNIPRKHPGTAKAEEIQLRCGSGMQPAFSQWLQSLMDGKARRMNGAVIIAGDSPSRAARLEFSNALLTEVGFPALDASSKDACFMTVKFTPEAVRVAKGSAPTVQTPGQAAQKTWLPSNFRLKLGNLPCDRVMKIEAFTVKQKMSLAGTEQDSPPSIVFTLPAAEAQPFLEWQKNKGLLEGSLTFLAPDRKEEIGGLDLHGVRLESIRTRPDRQGEEVRIKPVRCELK